MTTSKLPRPTRSSLLNRRLVKAINAMGGHYPQEEGLRTAARRSALPRAGNSDLLLAVAGGVIVLLLGLGSYLA